MKPKFGKFIGIFPVTVFISASLSIVCQAGIIGVNADGNAQPTVLDNGPNTIVATGGTSATPFVNIIAGVQMQGDIAQTAVLDISAPNYTVTNAGKLIGTNHTGIFSSFGFILTNSGTITSMNGNGINATDSVSATNSGKITGSNTGVWLNEDAEVTNYSIGNITGTNIGLRISDDSIVNNYGTIYGKVGIDAGTGSNAAFNLINTGWITGTEGIAIDGGSGTDTINLYNGSRINGGIDLMAGADAINMSTDAFYYVDHQSGHVSTVSCIVNGNIDGGTGIDVLTLGKGKILPLSPFSGFSSDSAANEVRGDVINMEDIIKNGSGVASIGEVGGPLRTVRTDAIHVNAGGLYINGNIDGTQANQTTIINDGAQLGGTGTWDANITLTGASNISPGQTALHIVDIVFPVAKGFQSVGDLTVTGNVTLSSTTTYEWNTTPGGSSDLIVLTGAGNAFMTDNSKFVIAPTNVNQPLQDGSRVVVDTQTMLSGVFGTIGLARFSGTTPDNRLILDVVNFLSNQINPILIENFSTLRKINSDQDWELTIVHDYSQFGTTDNQVAAGNMLNSLVSSATGDMADLLAALDYSDAQTTTNTLSTLDPSAYLSTVASLATQNYHLHRTIEAHNAAVRADSGSAAMPSGAPSAKGEALPAPDATACNGRSNVWGSISYDWQNLGNSSRGLDQTGDTASFTAGIDYNISQNLRLGLVAQGSQTNWHGDSALDSSIDSYNIAVYSSWGAATGWFVDALLGYNSHRVDQSRGILMGNINSIGTSQYDADGWQGLVSGGCAMQTSAGLFSPFIAFEWQQLSADSYSDSSPIPVNVGSTDIDSFRGLMGVKWEATLANKVKGYASAAYAYEFVDDAATTQVSFGGGSYTANGSGLSDAVLVSFGVHWEFMPCTTADFGYRGEFAMEDGVNSNGANIGVNYSF